MRKIIKEARILSYSVAILVFASILGSCICKINLYDETIVYRNESSYDLKLELFISDDPEGEGDYIMSIKKNEEIPFKTQKAADEDIVDIYGSMRLTFSDGVVTELSSRKYDENIAMYGKQNILYSGNYDYVDGKWYFTITNDLHDKHL